MTNSEYHRKEINQECLDMLLRTKSQLEKSHQSLMNCDVDLAEEVINTENLINAMNIAIDKGCEQFLALYNPVAVDLRFITAVRNINSELERIADHAYGISSYVSKFEKPIDKKLFEKAEYPKMYETVIDMFDNVIDAYNSNDVKMARKVFKKDKKVNKINDNIYEYIEEQVKSDVNTISECLVLFSIIKKLERVGDLIKNIAEDIIFYVDADIVKHKGKKKVS